MPKLKLPKLTTRYDCAPIGYPGLEVEYWLNSPMVDYEQPEDPRPEETSFLVGLAHIIEAVHIPDSMTESGEPETIPIPDGAALWALMGRDDFDPQIVHWTLRQHQRERSERERTERGN